jgi:hypothetical protein
MMKEENSKKDNEEISAIIAGIVLNTVSTYSSDRPLFKLLGLRPFTDIPTHKEYFVGEVKLENALVVKIWVFPAPAMFWKFEIFDAKSNKSDIVSTDSGALNNYWNSVKYLAENMPDEENENTVYRIT